MALLKEVPQPGFELDKVLLFIFVGLIFVVWIVVGAFIILDRTEWSKWEGWLDWGRNFAFVTVIPYLAKKVSQGIAKTTIT